MFQGGYALSLDAKGRLAIPARHREELVSAAQGDLILTASPDGCLLLYPLSAWEPIRDKILAAPSFNPRSQALKRVLVGNARSEQLDSAGRLLLAPELRGHAKLDKSVRLVGMGSHFEIWSDEGWAQQNAAATEAWNDGTPPAGFEDISL